MLSPVRASGGSLAGGLSLFILSLWLYQVGQTPSQLIWISVLTGAVGRRVIGVLEAAERSAASGQAEAVPYE